MVRFCDSFWDKDPVGTNGYESLIKRLKDGKKMCDEFSDFLRLRAKAEDEYGKTLLRLTQQAGGNEEIGTLREAWDRVKRETEKIGMSHCDFAKKLDDVDKNVKTFREEQKIERSKIDERMRKMQKDKKIVFDNVLKCKRQYEQRCKEFDAATESLESMSTYTPKEEDKLRSKKAKAKTTQEGADQLYQSSVKGLEQMHESWEKEMEVACDQFQALEEQRIRFLRNEMWLYSNFGSQMNVDQGQMYEEVRLQLEKCDDTKDITYFIHTKQSGSDRPAPLKYENYYHPQSTVVVAAAEIPKPKFLSLGRNVSPSKPSIATYGNLSPQSALPRSFSDTDDSNYATVQDSGKGRSSMELVCASFDYQPQGPEEISMKAGDIVEVKKFEDKEWARGRNQRTGKEGAFPVNFVQKFI